MVVNNVHLVKITVTVMYEMMKRDAELGWATACVGGGQGGTLIIKRK